MLHVHYFGLLMSIRHVHFITISKGRQEYRNSQKFPASVLQLTGMKTCLLYNVVLTKSLVRYKLIKFSIFHVLPGMNSDKNAFFSYYGNMYQVCYFIKKSTYSNSFF